MSVSKKELAKMCQALKTSVVAKLYSDDFDKGMKNAAETIELYFNLNPTSRPVVTTARKDGSGNREVREQE